MRMLIHTRTNTNEPILVQCKRYTNAAYVSRDAAQCQNGGQLEADCIGGANGLVEKGSTAMNGGLF